MILPKLLFQWLNLTDFLTKHVSKAIIKLALLSITFGAAAGAKDAHLYVDGTFQTVFDWNSQRCDSLHIPDSPARALRLRDGSILVMAPHLTNIPLLGPNFESLVPLCSQGSRGAESSDPLNFDDRFWIQAVVPLQSGQILGLASHEYMGGRHEGRCSKPIDERGRCWYSSIIATASGPNSFHFQPLPMDQRVIAASPFGYDSRSVRPTGFFSITNIVFKDDFAYLLAFQRGIGTHPEGTCIFRAPRNDLITGWRALAQGQFKLSFNSLTNSVGENLHESCDLVGDGAFRGPIRSVVRLTANGPWAAVLTGTIKNEEAGTEERGILYSISDDLLKWSQPKLLLSVMPFRGQRDRGIYYQYPSLIDHNSHSPIFDVANGNLYLYLTRFNLQEDRKRGMDRDLVRIHIGMSITTGQNHQ